MRSDINKMKDYFEVLDFVSETAPQTGSAIPANMVADIESGFENVNAYGGLTTAFLAGTIKGGEQERMNRLIFRVTRGKALCFFKEYKQDEETRTVY